MKNLLPLPVYRLIALMPIMRSRYLCNFLKMLMSFEKGEQLQNKSLSRNMQSAKSRLDSLLNANFAIGQFNTKFGFKSERK